MWAEYLTDQENLTTNRKRNKVRWRQRLSYSKTLSEKTTRMINMIKVYDFMSFMVFYMTLSKKNMERKKCYVSLLQTALKSI